MLMKNIMQKNKNAIFIIVCTIVCSITMCMADGIFKLPYVQKSILKVLLFLILPSVYLLSDKERRNSFLSLFYNQTQLRLANRSLFPPTPSEEFFRYLPEGVLFLSVVALENVESCRCYFRGQLCFEGQLGLIL